MSLGADEQDGKGGRDAGVGRTGGGARKPSGAGVRRDSSLPSAATSTTPRLGSVLLAIAVVALLTVGLHVLFQ
jgi:hypothetical protein